MKNLGRYTIALLSALFAVTALDRLVASLDLGYSESRGRPNERRQPFENTTMNRSPAAQALCQLNINWIGAAATRTAGRPVLVARVTTGG